MNQGLRPILSIILIAVLLAFSCRHGKSQSNFEKGLSYFESGNYDSAAFAFQQALRQDPANSSVRYNLALSWFETGNVSDALPEMEAYLERWPADPAARMNYGLMLFSLGSYKLAAEQFDEVMALGKWEVKAGCYRALCDYALGEYEEAQLMLEQCDSDSSLADVLTGIRGNAALITEDYESAQSFLTQAIDRKPDYAPYYLNRGIAYYHLDKFEKAIGDFTVCLALDSNISKAYVYRGLSEDALGNPDAAVSDLAKGKENVEEREGRLQWSNFLSRHWYALVLIFILFLILLISLISLARKKSEA